MKRTTLLLCGVAVSGVAGAADLISKSAVSTLNRADGAPETEPLLVRYCPKTNVCLNGNFTITSKGNGVLYVGRLGIRLYDAHDDGLYFDEPLLKAELKDLNTDGFLDLLLTGTALKTDDDGLVLNSLPVRASFIFSPEQKELLPSERSDYVYVFER